MMNIIDILTQVPAVLGHAGDKNCISKVSRGHVFCVIFEIQRADGAPAGR